MVSVMDTVTVIYRCAKLVKHAAVLSQAIGFGGSDTELHTELHGFCSDNSIKLVAC